LIYSITYENDINNKIYTYLKVFLIFVVGAMTGFRG